MLHNKKAVKGFLKIKGKQMTCQEIVSKHLFLSDFRSKGKVGRSVGERNRTLGKGDVRVTHQDFKAENMLNIHFLQVPSGPIGWSSPFLSNSQQHLGESLILAND